MESISLILPLASRSELTPRLIDAYMHVLQENGGFDSVEVIFAGGHAHQEEGVGAHPQTRVLTTVADRVGSMRAGLDEAAGKYLVVLDPERPYPPEALMQVIKPLRLREADLAIAVPQPFGNRSGGRSVWRTGWGLVSRLLFGTSDVLSGLVAIRRPDTDPPAKFNGARGSRIALDLLALTSGRHLDVPVTMAANDRIHIGSLGLDDLRQLKRVLDHRFGTFSRLVQFCIVGASGMVVDLSLYALFQFLFARVWHLPSGPAVSGFSWPLAVAGALSIFIALIWNFALNRRLTFNDAHRGSILRQFMIYALGNALGIGVSLFLRLYLPGHFIFFAQHRLAAAVVGIVVATGISFSMSRWVVFIRRPDSRAAASHSHLKVDSALPEQAGVS
jgi:dolichol-phosphate mannosyltransferase